MRTKTERLSFNVNPSCGLRHFYHNANLQINANTANTNYANNLYPQFAAFALIQRSWG